MRLNNDFFKEKTPFRALGYQELPTKTEKAIRVSIVIAEKGYNPEDDNHACFLEPGEPFPWEEKLPF
jgi:hypothetical protein